MKHAFRFKKRNGIYYVIFAKNPEKPMSTGKSNKADAIEWALLMIDSVDPSGNITFGSFATGFFGDMSQFIKRQKSRNVIWGHAHLSRAKGILDNYLLPRWEITPLKDIRPRPIDDWLISLNMASATKNKVLSTLRLILDDALEQELIEYNPARRLKPYQGKSKETKVFTPEELKILFAQDKAIDIWGTHEWYTYYLLLATCGLRPGEVKALQWRDWYKGSHGLIVSKAIEQSTGNVKGTKTGIVKPAVLTAQAEQALITLKAIKKPTIDDYLFPSAKNWHGAMQKHFKTSLQRAGIALDGRTPYSFRHTFNTLAMGKLPSGMVRILMGHKTEAMSAHYNHPTIDTLLEQVGQARDILEEIF